MKTKEQLRAELNAARDIATKAEAENRDMTPEEVSQVSMHLKAYDDAKREFEQSGGFAQGGEMKAALGEIGLEWGGEGGGTIRMKTQATTRSRQWSGEAMKAIEHLRRGPGTPDGVKAMISGTVSVPNLLDQGRPITIDSPTATVLDLIGRGRPSTDRLGNEFATLRQTTRTNNAAPVADLANKPQSDYGFGEVTDHYRVFAHKTEDLPYRYLDDYRILIDVIQTQLAEDLILAIEEDVIAGDGTGEHFIGLLNTSGIQAQAWTTDRITTLSNAKWKLLGQERPFNGWVFNPADLQALELMREDGATGAFLFKSRAEIAAFLGAPVAVTAGMPAGTALVGDYSEAELIPLGDDELVVDTGKRTTNNSFLMMQEGRYGFRVKKPVAFVEVDLTA